MGREDFLGRVYGVYQDYLDLSGSFVKMHTSFHIKTRLRFLLRLNLQDQSTLLDSLCKRCQEEIIPIGWSRLPFSEKDLGFEDWYNQLYLSHVLLQATHSGIEKAWEVIRQRYHRPLFHWLYQSLIDRSAGQQSREQAEEWVEIVFQKAWIHLSQFNPHKSAFYTWLMAIAKNLAFTKPSKADQNTTLRFEEIEEDAEDTDGVDRVFTMETPGKSPEERAEDAMLGEFFLNNLFTNAGYPWQVIAFTYQKLGYPPQEIVEHLAGCDLFTLSDKLFHELTISSLRPSSQIDALKALFERRLQKPLKESLNPKDNATKKAMAHSMDTIVGEIPLEGFLGSHPEKQISEWTSKVLIRLRNLAHEDH